MTNMMTHSTTWSARVLTVLLMLKVKTAANAVRKTRVGALHSRHQHRLGEDEGPHASGCGCWTDACTPTQSQARRRWQVVQVQRLLFRRLPSLHNRFTALALVETCHCQQHLHLPSSSSSKHKLSVVVVKRTEVVGAVVVAPTPPLLCRGAAAVGAATHTRKRTSQQ